MRQRMRGCRAANCLFDSSADVFTNAMAKKADRFDWRKLTSANFYPASEMIKRLVSKKARSRRGLAGGLTYRSRPQPVAA
jgi:hypothetical protein